MKIKTLTSFILATLLFSSCAPAATPLSPMKTAISTATLTPIPTGTATITPTPDKPVGTEQQSSLDGMTQLYIPAGKFKMGTSADGDFIGEDEFPLHEVFLRSFWMDQTEVTNAQYQQCVQAGVCTPPHAMASETHKDYFDNPDFAEYPVIQVDWEQAQTYCQWAGRRLPTEAEWEKAARGTSEQTFPWPGNKKGPHYANFDIDDDWPNADTSRVGSLPGGKSPYKIMDMAGNVYEWVADWYAADYYQHSSVENPGGPEQGTGRVIRGGAWSSDWMFIRTASRLSYYLDGYSNDIGFRCAQSE